jgi:hypothetical protein
MGNVIIVAGDSGTGKSSSLKTLNPESTVIVNVLGKELPWRGSKKDYNPEKKNIRKATKSPDIIATIASRMLDPKIETIVIDDIGFSMLEEYFDKASVSGFGKFVEMSVNLQKIIKYAKDDVPADKTVIFMFHTEQNEKEALYKIKTIGKMIDNAFNPLSIVTICMFTEVKFDKEEKPVYNFITNRSINNEGITIPAKSPEGMFSESRIPNDMKYVLDCMNAYYAGDEPVKLKTITK